MQAQKNSQGMPERMAFQFGVHAATNYAHEYVVQNFAICEMSSFSKQQAGF